MLNPMDKIGMDQFELNGSHYLLVVDYYSGFMMFHNHRKTPTSEDMQHVLKEWFLSYSWPPVIRSDNSPQFRQSFGEFCQNTKIIYEPSSPYHTESNAAIERSVRLIKSLMNKCNREKGEPSSMLYIFQNTPWIVSAMSAGSTLHTRSER